MPEPYRSRPFQPGDMERICGLIKNRPAKRILDYPALADIEETLILAHLQATTRVWECQDRQFAGYAFLNHGSEYAVLAFEVDPRCAEAGLEEEMLGWGEQIFCDAYIGQSEELSSSVVTPWPERVALLERHAYQPDAESVLYYTRPLDRPIPVTLLPPGFIIRPLAGVEEAPAWVDLHRAAFGTENMTVENRLAMMSVGTYRPELDLVAVAPDGRLAAYVYGSIHPEENALSGQDIGWTDPVATHPDYQRMGLSRALLLESLRCLKATGMQLARLGTSSANTAMQRAAQSAGYEQAGQAFHYSKKLRGIPNGSA